ncbi:MAG: dihydrofolate reductase family protein [Pontimonas sp.]
MNLYRVFPEPREMLPLDDVETPTTLEQWYRPEGERSVRLSLISSPSGRLVGADGTSTSLSNPVDRAILLTQRRLADAVVCGAQTMRSELVPIPSHAPLVVLSSSGDLRDHKVTEASFRAGGVMILTGPSPQSDPRSFFPEGVASHSEVGHSEKMSAEDILGVLSDLSYHHILVEGGRSVAEAFAHTGVLDEVCMTLTGPPLSENHPPLPWWQAQWGEWSAQHVLTDDLKSLYFRYLRIER